MVPALIGVCLTGYFAYHTVQGDRGLMAHWRLAQEVEAAEAVFASVQAERERMEHRVALLRPESLDPDMLDERSRLMLNVIRPDEVVIYDRWGSEGSATGPR